MKISPKDKKIIENNPLVFSTISNNSPYGIIVSCSKVIDDKILITDNFMKTAIKNILENKNISLVGWDEKYNGLQVLGGAKYYNTGKWIEYVKNMKENKNMPAKGAILITIKKIINSK